jgi:hypothetical protein
MACLSRSAPEQQKWGANRELISGSRSGAAQVLTSMVPSVRAEGAHSGITANELLVLSHCFGYRIKTNRSTR